VVEETLGQRSDAALRQRGPHMKGLWLWPGIIGLLSAIGLLAGLVSDGFGDAAAWVGLGVPVAITAWFGLRR
jgi:hypothetical protein